MTADEQYTDEACGAAGDDDRSTNPRQVSYAIDDAIGTPIYAFRAARSAIRKWQRSLLPARTPERMCDLFWFGLVAALPGLIKASTWALHLSSGVGPATDDVWSLPNISTFPLALIGLLLSFGILTEKSYARRLAVVFAIAWAFLPLRRQERPGNERSWRIAVPIVWTYETLKYLLSYTEVSDYYELLRSERSQQRTTAATSEVIEQTISGVS